MTFSKKQLWLLSWWLREENRGKTGIICDGAVRSGKTFSMSHSFFIWSMMEFNGRYFAFCGKTIASLRRNVTDPLIASLAEDGFLISEAKSKNYFEVSRGRIKNRYYLFGGKDSGSAALIQGITLAGVMFDEAALMPRSFVEQAAARCSVDGSKLWFNLNPESPYHWFKREWIDKRKEKGLVYVKFTLDDNPSLSEAIKERYTSLFSGAFYRRFVLGEWSGAYGLVYPEYETAVIKCDPLPCSEFVISCDYGTVNPSSFGLWGKDGSGVWIRLCEYYFDSRKQGWQKTDEEHYEALKKLAGGRKIECVIVDPSAASFIECITRHKEYKTKKAKNDVLTGIRQVSDAIRLGRIKISERCADTLREFTLYRWDEKSDRDAPLKENDHAMDDLRYFVSTYLYAPRDDFYCLSAAR